METTLSRREFGSAAAGTAAALAMLSEHNLNQSVDLLYIGEPEEDGAYVAEKTGIGKRIRNAREARGLTIEQCAYAIDPSCQNHWYATWYYWEQEGSNGPEDEPQIWPAIEALLGVTVPYLLHSRAQLAVVKKIVSARLGQFKPDAEIVFDRYDQGSGISERIKEARERHGLTLAQAGARIEKTARDWQRYENGGWPVLADDFLLIAQALNVNFNWLILGEQAKDFEIPPTTELAIPVAV